MNLTGFKLFLIKLRKAFDDPSISCLAKKCSRFFSILYFHCLCLLLRIPENFIHLASCHAFCNYSRQHFNFRIRKFSNFLCHHHSPLNTNPGTVPFPASYQTPNLRQIQIHNHIHHKN